MVSGVLTLAGGAVSNYAEVEAGGMVEAAAEAVLNNTTVQQGGTLSLAAGSELNGMISVAGSLLAGGAVDASGCVIDFDLTGGEVAANALTGVLVNDITRLEGASLAITISSQGLEDGEYRLAGNAAGFAGSISCHSEMSFACSYAELDLYSDCSFALNGKLYTLAVNAAEELVLQVRPIEPGDDTAPRQITDAAANVYAGMAMTLYWSDPAANSAVSYLVRYGAAGSGLENAETVTVNSNWAFLSDLEAGGYEYQVRAVDADGQLGEWSEVGSFRISEIATADTNVVLSTELWGHDYLPELYGKPAIPQHNDVTGYYFADAEKLNNVQDALYCWGAASANVLTWTGWAANSPYAFANEDEVFEYFINYWKNEGGMESDAQGWFLTGEGLSGTMVVPAEGGNLFPGLELADCFASIEVSTETSTLLNLLADYFDAGYGISYAIYSDAGLAHAITGWGYEVDDAGNIYLYYSDSDSDYWSGSDDRREAINRLSRTRVTVHDDGRLFFEDYFVPGAYLGSFSALKQFDKNLIGQSEDFADARLLEWKDGGVLRAGNLDGEGDEDYYMFTAEADGEVTVTVSMASSDSLLSGLVISVYDSFKNLIGTSAAAALEQVFHFGAIANSLYYLVVSGDELKTGGAVAPALNTYYVEIEATPTPVPHDWRSFGVGDFNRSGIADVFRQDKNSDALAVIYDSDGQFTASDTLWKTGDWKAAGCGDINGDGAADVLIKHFNAGNDTTDIAALVTDPETLEWVHADVRGFDNSTWEYLGCADVNGDGIDDILTIETESVAAGRDRNVNAWIMGADGRYEADLRICGKNADWQIAGFGDVTGDGRENAILRNADGMVGYWEHNGTDDAVLHEISGLDSKEWSLLGIGDFDGDGISDILWQCNVDDSVGMWTKLTENNLAYTRLGQLSELGDYTFSMIGDFNGDGKDDILWAGSDDSLAWSSADPDKFKNLVAIA